MGALRCRPFVRDGKPTGQWTVDVPANLSASGRRQRKLFDTEDEAQSAARSYITHMRLSGAIQATNYSEPEPSLPLPDVIDAWAAEQEVRVAAGKKKSASLVTNLYQLRSLLRFCGPITIADLGDPLLLRYQAHRRAEGAAAITINSEIATLKQVVAWARGRGVKVQEIAIDPVPVPPPSVTIIEPWEAARVIAHLPERHRVLVQLIAGTGCRWGEATHLRWLDLDLDRGVARIEARDEWTPKTFLSVRPLRLSTTIVEALKALPRSGEFVFPNRHGTGPVDDIRKALRNAVALARVERNGKLVNVTPKLLRACFATWQARSGTRERVLQEMLGHVPGSRVTKRHYEFSTAGEVREASDRIWSLLEAPALQPVAAE